MNSIDSQLNALIEFLNKLYGMPAAGIVLLSCLVVGYLLKFLKRFPNQGIPVAVILWGGAFYPLVADLNSEMPWRIWFIKNFLFGLVVGFIAWLLHNKLLSKFEDKIPVISSLVSTDKPAEPTEPQTLKG